MFITVASQILQDMPQVRRAWENSVGASRNLNLASVAAAAKDRVARAIGHSDCDQAGIESFMNVGCGVADLEAKARRIDAQTFHVLEDHPGAGTSLADFIRS